MTAALVALISAPVSALLGLLGGVYLTRKRDANQARAAILSIVLEMSLLEDVFAQAIEHSHRLRDEISREAWEEHSGILVNWLPWHLVTALHVHQQQFATVKEIYRRLTTSLTSGPALDDMYATLWCFVYWSRFLREQIQAAVARLDHSIMPRRPNGASPSKQEEEKLARLLERLNSEALSYVRSKGIEPKTYVPIGVTTIH
jgi:hypothetical protein